MKKHDLLKRDAFQQAVFCNPGCPGSPGEALKQRVLLDSGDADLLAVAAQTLELDLAVDQGEEGIVRTLTDVFTGMDVGTALTDEDVARENGLPVGSLHAKTLGFGITAVLGRAHTFFMSEKLNVNAKHRVAPPF